MGRNRVLLADDQPIVRRSLDLLLKEEPDFEVVGQTGDGVETVEAVRQLIPDVVLMDIEMPGLSGPDATRRIKQSNPDVSILMLTVYDREDFLSDSLHAGALGYVLKAASVEELIGAIRTVHRGEVFIQPRMATKLVGEFLNRSRNDQESDSYKRLSAREREVLLLLAESHSN